MRVIENREKAVGNLSLNFFPRRVPFSFAVPVPIIREGLGMRPK